MKKLWLIGVISLGISGGVAMGQPAKNYIPQVIAQHFSSQLVNNYCQTEGDHFVCATVKDVNYCHKMAHEIHSLEVSRHFGEAESVLCDCRDERDGNYSLRCSVQSPVGYTG